MHAVAVQFGFRSLPTVVAAVLRAGRHVAIAARMGALRPRIRSGLGHGVPRFLPPSCPGVRPLSRPALTLSTLVVVLTLPLAAQPQPDRSKPPTLGPAPYRSAQQPLRKVNFSCKTFGRPRPRSCVWSDGCAFISGSSRPTAESASRRSRASSRVVADRMRRRQAGRRSLPEPLFAGAGRDA